MTPVEPPISAQFSSFGFFDAKIQKSPCIITIEQDSLVSYELVSSFLNCQQSEVAGLNEVQC